MLPPTDRPGSVRELVARELRHMLKKDYEPGQVLPSEKELSRRLNVSVHVLRPAIAELRREGLVVSKRGELHRVRPAAEIVRVVLSPGEWATCRVVTEVLAARELGVEPGAAVVEIFRSSGVSEVYPAFGSVLAVEAV